jgi:hypothetical protein
MTQLTDEQLIARLRALYEDVNAFPPGVYCSWPLARVFNELLAASKQVLDGDPVVTNIGTIRKRPDEEGLSTAHAGTIRGLLGQLLAALEHRA